jgi:hypothetical protein
MQLKKSMAKPSNEFVHLEFTFPDIIRKIKVYMGMDMDFARLCKDFDEVVESMNFLENANGKATTSIKSQIASYKQLKEELRKEIEDFIQEEQKSN